MKRSNGLSLPNWIVLNKISQIIVINPTRTEALNFQTSPFNVTLTAIDKTGLTAFITVQILLVIPLQPKYSFTFQYTISPSAKTNRVLETMSFSQKMAQYLGESSTEGVGLLSYTMTSTVAREFTYASCSITYSPCDIASLATLRSKFINEKDFPENRFQSAMSPEYTIQYAHTTKKFPCTGTTPSPPRVVVVINILIIPICGYYEYLIPENTFYDSQDGNTRKLTLSFSSNSESWFQFDSSRQTIYAMPIAQDAIDHLNGYSFTLTATDSSQLPAVTPVNVKFNGQFSLIQECQIRMDFKTTDLTSTKLARVRYIISKLHIFFQLSSEADIAVSNYISDSESTFRFYWSYCSPDYRQSSTTVVVDYYGFITNILMRLFNSDRKTVTSSFYSIFGSKYIVTNVVTQFSKRCSDLPPIVPPNTASITLALSSCGYTKRNLQNTLFYDFEQGGTLKLDLSMYAANSVDKLPLDSWINVDKATQSIIAVCNDNIRGHAPNTYMYILKATDSKGQSAQIQVKVEKSKAGDMQFSPFDITFEMKYNGPINRPMVYQTNYMADRIKSYYQITGSPAVLVKSFDISPGYSQYRKLTWTTCTYEPCSSNVFAKTKSLYTEAGNLLTQFKNTFLNDFAVERVYYTSTTCSPTSDPPFNPNPLPSPLTPEFCSLFIINLPEKLFYDNVNGDIRKLNVRLVDSNSNEISQSSWIQLNSATLQLYAINILSVSKSSSAFNYKIAATNSGRLPAYVPFEVKFSNQPYVSDCPISIRITYKYMTTKTADLDVLWRIVTALQSYYNDESIKTKILDFYRIGNNDFFIKWSNCSFSFSSYEQAKRGLTEINREKITLIFSKIININTQIVTNSFKTAMFAFHFIVKSATVSYSCIEKDPYPPSNAVYKVYVKFCEFFNHTFPNDLFLDQKDGDIRNMRLSLTDLNGKAISSNEWVQIQADLNGQKYIYGTLTTSIVMNAPQNGYRYLLMCTDSSGRMANISLNVFVVERQNQFSNEFYVGFTSNFARIVPTAYILANITQTLAKFMYTSDGKTQLYISYFNRKSFIQFSHCNLVCNEVTFSDIYKKFQVIRYQHTPSIRIVDALRKEFEVSYVYISAPRCVPNNNQSIVPNPCPAFKVLSCGWFNIVIPPQCFRDAIGRTTQEFLLKMSQTNGSPLQINSWIQFDIPIQSIYGIPIWNQMLSTQTFKFTAKHPISGNYAVNNVNVDISNYNLYNTINDKVCQITMTFQNNVIFEQNDVEIVRDFLIKLSQFINNATADINSYYVMKFQRTGDIMSITYSNCTWMDLMQTSSSTVIYLKEVFKILEHFFIITGTNVIGIKNSFREYLNPRYTFISLKTSNGCTNPPTPPPMPTRELIININNNCGEFSYSIPADTFKDQKYGNTRNLVLKIIEENGQDLPKSTWLNIGPNQDIYGLVDKRISENMPRDGYKYSLRATNPNGQSSTTRVSLILPMIKWTSEIISVRLAVNIFNPIKLDVDYKIELTRQVSSYQVFTFLKKGFYVKSFSYINGNQAINSEIAYCEQCDSVYYTRAQQVNNNKILFEQWLRSTSLNFLFASNTIINENCATGDFEPRHITLSLCKKNEIFLSSLYTSYIEKLTIQMFQANGSEISWIHIIDKPYKIVAYPTEKIWKEQPSGGYLYKMRIIINGVIIYNQKFNFKIEGSPPSDVQKYTLAFRSSKVPSTTDTYYINDIWGLLSRYVGDKGMQHISFTRDTNTKFIISWYNCSLPTNCLGTEAQQVNSKLFNANGQVSSQFKAQFPNTYEVISLTSTCNNNPPVVPLTYIVNISACGIFTHTLPNDFAYDSTDGYLENLSVQLRNSDGSIIKRDSWIKFNEAKKEIVALPNEFVIASSTISGKRFIIYVTDSSQKTSMTTLIVNIINKKQSYYKLKLSFQSSYPTTVTYVEIQKRMIDYLSKFVGDENINFQLLSFNFQLSDQLYFLKLNNCSVGRYICAGDNSQLQLKENTLKNSDGTVELGFKNYIFQMSEGKITMRSITIESLFITDTPPQVLGGILPTLNVTYCSTIKYKVPDTLFSDRENEDDLIYNLVLSNGNQLPSSNWINMYGSYIFATADLTTSPGISQYAIKVTDRCGQSNTKAITINLNGNSFISPYTITMKFDPVVFTTTYSYEIGNIQEKLKQCYGGNSDGIRTESFQYINSYMQYKWSNCSIKTSPCDIDEIDKIHARTFSTPTTLNTNFVNCFKPYILKQVVEHRFGSCSPPTTNPPTVNIIPKITAEFCQKLHFKIDANTFYDNEDGNSRNLQLQLLYDNLEPIKITEWVQFDQENQVIYGYPRTGESPDNVRTSFVYKLKATDSSQSYAMTDVVITLVGAIPPLTYIMVMNAISTLKGKTDVDEEVELMKKLRVYYNKQNINAVSFSRIEKSTGNNITSKWSFCQFKTETCDCFKVKQFHEIIHLGESSTFASALKPSFLFRSASDKKYGNCFDNAKPEVINTIPVDVIYVGQCFSFTVPENTFYDVEDGGTRNLTLSVSSVQNVWNQMDNSQSSWMRMNHTKQRICGILSYKVYETVLKSTSTYKYSILAEDACGKSSITTATSNIVNNGYQVTMNYIYKMYIFKINGDLISSCSDMEHLIYTIALYNENKKTDILVEDIYTSANLTGLIWGYRYITDKNCSNNTITILRKKFFVNDTYNKNPIFVDYMYNAGYVVDGISEILQGPCLGPVLPPGQRQDEESTFPWYILWILLVLALLVLLLWLFWFCCPRLCPSLCATCSCCGSCLPKCCAPSGSYSSFNDEKKLDDVETGKQTRFFSLKLSKSMF